MYILRRKKIQADTFNSFFNFITNGFLEIQNEMLVRWWIINFGIKVDDDCFCGMIDLWTAVSHISWRDHWSLTIVTSQKYVIKQ